MESKDLSMYTIKTEDIIQQGKDIFPAYAHLFELSTPGSYMQFYDIDMGIKTKTVSVLSSFLEELNGLKSRIHDELFAIISRPDATVGESNVLMKSIHQLGDDLTLFEKKFSEYPLRTFVASVMEKGTPLDIIGLIEKFRYDRVFNDNASHKLPMYIDELIRMFKIKHGDVLYQKIESFRSEYLQLLSDKIHAHDVMDESTYMSFMTILARAEQHQFFDYSLRMFLDEMQKQALATLPDDHEVK